MKVLAATPLYPPESRVGAWLSTHRCLAHLVQRGHEVEVVTLLTTQAPYELDGVRVIGGRVSMGEAVRRADVAISHMGDSGRCAAAAAQLGVPSVRMVHGKTPAMVRKLDKHPTALAVFNSRSFRDEVGWDGPSIVIHPPVNPDEFSTTPGEHVTLVNLSPAKGGDLFAFLAKLLPDVKFLGVMGGYGQQRRRYARNLTVLRPTPNMRDHVYARTRVLLMPSAEETWGMVGVEAMCSGIPVIAHPTPGLRESLGDAGIFVDRENISGWVREITRLQDPAEWAAASARALERVAQLDHRADLDRFADAVESLVPVAA